MKVAIIHYWLVNMRGGEKVLEALCSLYPEADIYTHVVERNALGRSLRAHAIHTTFVSRLPGAVRHYQKYLPLMPLALEQLDLRDYDLVISSESGPAKGVITSPDTLHVCYCHSPMRYIWDMYPDYLAAQAGPVRLLMRPLFHYLRLWDQASADRVDHFVANSHYVARRIEKVYRRQARVIHPPVDVAQFEVSSSSEDFYLLLGQLVNYKRADLAVEAFTRMGKPLVVIGEGEQMDALKAKAGANVCLLGRQPFEVIKDHYRRCRALVFPGLEDFGIVPVEAMASGKPVIAYGRGGALETVVEGKTGVFFREQTVEALMEAVARFESMENAFSAEEIARHAACFDITHFKRAFSGLVGDLLRP